MHYGWSNNLFLLEKIQGIYKFYTSQNGKKIFSLFISRIKKRKIYGNNVQKNPLLHFFVENSDFCCIFFFFLIKKQQKRIWIDKSIRLDDNLFAGKNIPYRYDMARPYNSMKFNIEKIRKIGVKRKWVTEKRHIDRNDRIFASLMGMATLFRM